MRCVLCALSVCLLLGCRNQQGSPIANPFLTPDRVPPPGTRVLPPGSASPYYSSNPAPSLPAAGFPAQNYQPPPVPAGSIYAPAQQIPPTNQPPFPTTPSNGWNRQPASGSSSRNIQPNRYIQPSSAEFPLDVAGVASPPLLNQTAPGQVIRIQSDQQNLRFAPASTFAAAPPILPTDPYFSQANVQVLAQQPARMPIQSILPRQQNNPLVGTNGQPQYAPSSPAFRTQQVRIREVASPTESERIDPSSNFSAGRRTRDGFRPQGSSQSANRVPLRSDPRSAVTPAGHVTPRDNTGRFGFDTNYQWLRGQVEYSPSTGQWRLRYTSAQEAATDPLGGSVAIENPHVLGNLQSGDFVQVQGSLRAQQRYAITVVQRQRPI